ncbi:uncharacterized protein LOC117665440 isoform X1 [Pantherophis guttatus]|uniref:Uncharacterized protein LOC117665440 isoform X1 n=1 Tax=Pantherophis guttatus TaxID=94885 RepID=A0A6P9C043_PANGU|nr:uncharacterized protein LOC117665440 isoform X1 [Pantherophis guttatus]XP_060542536.1 uncharacterized protein LOC117665440 isoform X1 [Pantherophis guttatus]XP_060542537.1 uncharacterized protein LOC117665440 isoform X1 [Pantherophis guttatus]XP_060542539.1 uncharacterized protein LOC117665440 isoform X1 [Pantherophis guttatus]XP_060542540.1 uncharacterized protein LOC117665440 isoform X1 [Pantherophis guttatus]XP_060542541.1 uncharacterized protein LOC117665440 isoform X1 [Pantherophis gut
MEWLLFPGTHLNNHHNGCEQVRLGCTPAVVSCSGPLVLEGLTARHKLVRAAGSPSRPAPFPAHCDGASHVGPYGQYNNESPREQGRRNSFQVPTQRVNEDAALGGEACSVTDSGAHIQRRQHPGGLAHPDPNRSSRVASPSVSICSDTCRGGLVSQLSTAECSAAPLLQLILLSRSGRLRCTSKRVAPGPTLCFSSSAAHPSGDLQAAGGEGGPHPSHSQLAVLALVCRPLEPISGTPLAHSQRQDTSQPGGHTAPRPAMVAVDRLAFERIHLRKDNIPVSVIHTMQSARRPSTNCIYDANWRLFCSWGSKTHQDPKTATPSDVLVFLQDGLDRGLAPNTLRYQVAALGTVLTAVDDQPLTLHPCRWTFLRGGIQSLTCYYSPVSYVGPSIGPSHPDGASF